MYRTLLLDPCIFALAELMLVHLRDPASYSSGILLWQQLSGFHCSIWFYVSETSVFCLLFTCLFAAIFSHIAYTVTGT